jgi:predicted regulator of Ras-like GTPase activity (Roadblock/LC7/MglB family)
MSGAKPSRVSRELAKKVLETLGEIAGVRSAVLFTADGFEVAAHAADSATSARLAAMGSSLAALGTAISAEAGLKDFDRSTIESSDGTVVIMHVGNGSGMSVAVVANKEAVLGQLLWAIKRCCQALQKIMI